MLGFHVLLDAVSECVVNRIPLVDHCSRALVEKSLNLVSHVAGCGPFALGTLDVIVAELGPRSWHRVTERNQNHSKMTYRLTRLMF